MRDVIWEKKLAVRTQRRNVFQISTLLGLQEVFRTTAIKALSERLTQTIASANEHAARETDQLFAEQAELGRRKEDLDRGLQEAQVRKH